MPVISYSGAQQNGFLINDLINEVLFRCENRTTDTSRAAIWLRDSLLEITSNPDYRDDFQELEEWGPTVNLTGGQNGSNPPAIQEYVETTFVPTGDIDTAICDILIWIDYPANTIRRKLDIAHYQKSDRFQPTFSLPTEWYRFGGMIGFNPIPDLNYQVQARLSKRHPINDANLPQTAILIPREWNEVLIWAAVQRGFMELMEFEKANKVHLLLYGDPNNKAQPGLIYHIKRQRRREQWRMEQSLRVVKRPVMWGY